MTILSDFLLSALAASSIDCGTDIFIPANPDISGIGVRVAIYVQNLLSFIPAFYALKDGKISVKELQVVEKQSTTILITAFAVLISAMVQAGTYGLYSFHTSIILSLSWMNNTNTFIYFLLYIHHKIDPALDQSNRVQPQWTAWFYHVVEPFGIHRKDATKQTKHDTEASSPTPRSISSNPDDAEKLPGQSAPRSQSTEREGRISWAQTCWDLIRRKFVLVLGSLHLTAMAALGIWLWSSPSWFETTQSNRLHLPLGDIPLPCTNTTLFGASIPLTSAALNRTSLVFYSAFLPPCLNLVVPAAFFLLLFMRPAHLFADDTAPPEDKVASTSMLDSLVRLVKAAWPIMTGLLILLAINIVFIIDIETTIKRAVPYQNARDEARWTFGQTLALLLLILPMRDVYDYIRESQKAEYAKKCTEDLKTAVVNRNPDALCKAAQYADNVHAYIDDDEFPFALQFAASLGDLKSVSVILERNPNINVEGVAAGGSHGSPLVAAASAQQEAVVQALLRVYGYGAALGLSDSDGLTALHYAAQYGAESTTSLLLHHKAYVNARSNGGRTPLHSAITADGIDSQGEKIERTIRLLLDNGADVNQSDDTGWTPLTHAAHNGHTSVARILLDHGADARRLDKDKCGPMCHAAANGNHETMKVLLDYWYIPVDFTDGNKQTPLMHAAENGHEMNVQLLLEQGADVNLADTNGMTSLHYAAFDGHETVVQLLLKHGADADKAANDGETPLTWAVYRDREPIIQLLLEHGVDVNKATAHGYTPLHRVAKGGDASLVRLLLDHGSDINKVTQHNSTPLNLAAEYGNESVVRLLLERGADIDKADNDGDTPFLCAALNDRVQMMNMLLTSGADFEHARNTGQTALMYAAMENRPAAVKFLLDRGADFTKTDKRGRTALDIARTNEYEEIVEILEAAGAGQRAGGELERVPRPHPEGIPMEEEDAGSGGPRPLDRG